MIVDAAVFTLMCAVLFLVPMLPALIEWRRKRDAEPLKVVRDYDGNIEHFANGFRHFLTQQFGTWLDTGGAAPDRVRVLVAGDDGAVLFSASELASGACARLLLARGPLALGDGMFYEKELYGGARLSSGDRNSFRAILACGDIALGADCSVLRWAHSDASVTAGVRARLYGRVSAAGQIHLQRGSRFGRMSAPQIRFGPPAPVNVLQPQRPRQPLALPDDLLDQSAQRWLIGGNLAVPADTSHRGDLVARKHVTIGNHATIHGNIKSNGDMVIGDDVHIEGALVATGKLCIGARCLIKGPVVCDGQVVLCHGTVIGRQDLPTTVTATEIRVEEGVLAHGTVWAREVGLVTGPRT